ncbi:hypothetical protein TUBRATIS_10450 [Tubulinosema ratisbonensis]|uniref:Ricin B lectin domain-containing protein n=1 Tax=Tubulinosema ratisbonensis TaxID=291195 RepID=A0A437AN39_9MICR|nr:hypothetical protein TUBRATIS_10450 [Tubulinosema ratisbonensis]
MLFFYSVLCTLEKNKLDTPVVITALDNPLLYIGIGYAGVISLLDGPPSTENIKISASRNQESGRYHILVENIMMCHRKNNTVGDCNHGDQITNEWFVTPVIEGGYMVQTRIGNKPDTLMCLTRSTKDESILIMGRCSESRIGQHWRVGKIPVSKQPDVPDVPPLS